MRAVPLTVSNWFTTDISDDLLSRRIATLRADPDWRAIVLDVPRMRMLLLFYFPTAQRLEIVVIQTGSTWKVALLQV